MADAMRRRTAGEGCGLVYRAAVDASDAEGVEAAPSVFEGHAAVFDQWTVIERGVDEKTGRPYEDREVIRRGAFRAAIDAGQDVRALVDHNPSLILGRTRAGTLTLAEDDIGLHCSIRSPDTTLARDLFANVIAGNVTQMSFAFLVRPGGERTTVQSVGGVTVRETEVTDCDLFDVSIVTYPAYSGTDINARSGSAGFDEAAAALVARRRAAGARCRRVRLSLIELSSRRA